MPRPTIFPVKKLIAITPEVAQAIEDYRFSNRLKTEAEAIRRLIEAGLNAPDEIPIRSRKTTSGDTGGGKDDVGNFPTSPSQPKRTSPPRKTAPISKEAQLRALREQGAR